MIDSDADGRARFDTLSDSEKLTTHAATPPSVIKQRYRDGMLKAHDSRAGPALATLRCLPCHSFHTSVRNEVRDKWYSLTHSLFLPSLVPSGG